MNITKLKIFPYILILLFSLLWGYPLVAFDHIWITSDLFTHYRWASQFIQALSEGVLHPKWASLSHFGAGDPTFLYYQPGYYYVVAFFKGTGINLWSAMKAGLIFSNFLFGIIVFRIVRTEGNTVFALFAAAFAQFQPFSFFLAYFYNAFPWFFSIPFAAIVLWRSSIKNLEKIDLLLTLSFCILILSHILTAFMCLIVLAITRVIAGLYWRNMKDLVNWCISIGLGLGLSAYYFLPAFLTRSWISPQGWYENGILDWKNSFIFPVFSSAKWGMRWFSVQWLHSGFLVAVFIAIFLLAIVNTRQELKTFINKPYVLPCLLILSITLVFSSELSYALWLLIDTLKIIQFPYRFITILLLCLAVFGPILLNEYCTKTNKSLFITKYILLTIPLFAVLILQIQIINQGSSPKAEFKNIMSNNFGAAEYFPANVAPQWKDYFLNGGLNNECRKKLWHCKEGKKESHYREWTLSGNSQVELRLPIFDFPAWNINHQQVQLPHKTDPKTGLLLIDLPPGKYTITLSWQKTGIELAGQTISVASLIIFLLLFIFQKHRSLYKERRPIHGSQ